jgi:uncharacterized repeat protein (TIGR03803 family)
MPMAISTARLLAGAPASCFGGGCGTIFKIDTAGNETDLYNFTGGTDGNGPAGGVIRDPAGNLYGMAGAGGDLTKCGGNGCGTVFKLDPSRNLTTLHIFESGVRRSAAFRRVGFLQR